MPFKYCHFLPESSHIYFVEDFQIYAILILVLKSSAENTSIYVTQISFLTKMNRYVYIHINTLQQSWINNCMHSSTVLKHIFYLVLLLECFALKMVYIGLMVQIQRQEFRYITVNGLKFLYFILTCLCLPVLFMLGSVS